jgi:hypothetical protein
MCLQRIVAGKSFTRVNGDHDTLSVMILTISLNSLHLQCSLQIEDRNNADSFCCSLFAKHWWTFLEVRYSGDLWHAYQCYFIILECPSTNWFHLLLMPTDDRCIGCRSQTQSSQNDIAYVRLQRRTLREQVKHTDTIQYRYMIGHQNISPFSCESLPPFPLGFSKTFSFIWSVVTQVANYVTI